MLRNTDLAELAQALAGQTADQAAASPQFRRRRGGEEAMSWDPTSDLSRLQGPQFTKRAVGLLRNGTGDADAWRLLQPEV